MPGSELLIAFVLAASVFAYMPGPAMLYATAQTLAHGSCAGWHAVLGLHIGGYAHVVAAAFGLAILFQAVPALFVALKLAGAAYLVYLGVTLILSRSDAPEPAASHTSRPSSFRDSMIVELLNPKTALFYLAFLPQFSTPEAAFPVWLQLLILGTIVNVMFSSADVMCVLLASRLSSALRRSNAAALWMRRAGGAVLVGLGTKLGLSS